MDEEKLKAVWNETLIYITVGYFFIHVAFYFIMMSMNGGSSLAFVFVLPVFWVLTIIGVGVFAYQKREALFEKKKKNRSIILLLFCTPFPFIVFGQILGLIFGL
ncbi:MAG: hypothetical protein COB73_04830 [Flavobacteriaceae bacterium]|nr:MAG: hypothetical protein COB73_04830 [Flavobacteriaceae bacterium]